MRAAIGLVIVVMSFAAMRTADATCYAAHMQGRGWKGWDSMQNIAANNCTNVFFNYDGNSSLTDSTTTSEINNWLINTCNTTSNSCVMLCYSAGCLRMQKAVSDLHAAGYPLSGILWAEATAGAAGGTGLAELATSGGTKIIAKLIGQQEKIDFSLTPSAARAQAQSNFGKNIYHLAGNQDICKGFWIFKMCGNKYVNSAGGGADGVVPFHSAYGCSTAGAYSNANACTKYTYHLVDTTTGTSIYGEPFDHFGMPNVGCKVVKAFLDSTQTTAVAASWSDQTTNGLCSTNDYSCDDRFYQTAQNFSKKPNLTVIATSVAAKASNTTLYTDSRSIAGPAAYGDQSGTWRYSCGGKCGGNNTYGGLQRCRCDAGCVAAGTCCSDYSVSVCTGRGLSSTDCSANTASCDVFNAQP